MFQMENVECSSRKSLPNVRQTAICHSAGSRDRFAPVLFRPALSMVLCEDNLVAVPPKHQNVPLFRAKKFAKAEQFEVGLIGSTIVRRHIGIEQANPDTLTTVRP